MDFNYTQELEKNSQANTMLSEGRLKIALMNRERSEKLQDIKSNQDFQLALHKAEIKATGDREFDMMLAKNGLSTSGSRDEKEKRWSEFLQRGAVNTYKLLKKERTTKQLELDNVYDQFSGLATKKADKGMKIAAISVALRDPALDSLPKNQRAKLEAAAKGNGDPDEAVKAVSDYMTSKGWFSDSPEKGRAVLDAYYVPLTKSLDEKSQFDAVALRSKYEALNGELRNTESKISGHMAQFGAVLPQDIIDRETSAPKIQDAPMPPLAPPTDPNEALKGVTTPQASKAAPTAPPGVNVKDAYESGGVAGAAGALGSDILSNPGSYAEKIANRAIDPLGIVPNANVENIKQLPGVIKDIAVGRSVPSIPPPTTAEMVDAVKSGRFNPQKHPGGVSDAMASVANRGAANGFNDLMKQKVQASLQENPNPQLFKVPEVVVNMVKQMGQQNGGTEETWNKFVDGIANGNPVHIATFNEMVKEALNQMRASAPPAQ